MDHHYEGCGTCKHCKGGWQQMPLDGTTVFGSSGHGAHAKYMRVPVSTLVPLPDNLSFTTGAAISCGTNSFSLRRLKIQGGETIAIFGQGLQGSQPPTRKGYGAREATLDISNERLELQNILAQTSLLIQ